MRLFVVKQCLRRSNHADTVCDVSWWWKGRGRRLLNAFGIVCSARSADRAELLCRCVRVAVAQTAVMLRRLRRGQCAETCQSVCREKNM